MSVFKRNQTWSYNVKWTDRKGTRHQKTKGGFPTKRDAQRAERELMTQIDRRKFPGRSGLTVENYICNYWLPHRQGLGKLKESTYETYKMLINAYIVPGLGSLRLEDLDTYEIESFIVDLCTHGRIKAGSKSGTKLKPKTVRNIVSVLQKSLQDAVKWKMITHNPAKLAEKPQVTKQDIDFMSPQNLMKYVRSLQDNRYRAALQLVALTGMRRGELLGLSWEDVNFELGTVKIKVGRIRAGNKIIMDTP
jgi:integrase